MLGTGSSKDLKKAELFDSLFQSIDQQFGDSEDILPFHEWAKGLVLDGRPFVNYNAISKKI